MSTTLVYRSPDVTIFTLMEVLKGKDPILAWASDPQYDLVLSWFQKNSFFSTDASDTRRCAVEISTDENKNLHIDKYYTSTLYIDGSPDLVSYLSKKGIKVLWSY